MPICSRRLDADGEGVDVAEEADGERSPDPRSQMDRNCADRVVDLHVLEQERDGLHDNGRHAADERGLPGAHDVGRGGDPDEPRQRPVHDRHDVGTPVEPPGEGHADQPAERGCERGVKDHRWHLAREREHAAAVEAEPADPEHEHSERRDRQVVAPNRNGSLAETPDPRPEDDDRGQRDPAAHRMDDRGACEVHEAELLQPAVRAARSVGERRITPGPVAEDGVGDRGDEDGEDEIAAEAHALGDRAGHERRRRPDESELEEEEGGQVGAVAVEEERR